MSEDRTQDRTSNQKDAQREPQRSSTSNLPFSSAGISLPPGEATAADSSQGATLENEVFRRALDRLPGGLQNVQASYPLSPMQEGLLFHHALNPCRDTYVLSVLFDVSKLEERESFRDAVAQVIARHDALRTAILWRSVPQPIQVVCRTVDLPVEFVRVTEDLHQCDKLKAQMIPGAVAIDLELPPLVRLKIASTADNRRSFALLVVHHSICDHSSLNLIVSEIETFLAGQGSTLPRQTSYRDYVSSVTDDRRVKHAQMYFRTRLEDVSEATAPFDILRCAAGSDTIVEAGCELDRQIAERLYLQARRNHVTPARIVHAAWAIVVAQTTGREDVVFGTVIGARRRLPPEASTVGLLVNTLPIRVDLNSKSVLSVVHGIDAELSELVNWDHVSLTEAVGCSSVPSDRTLFSSILNYRRTRAPTSKFQSGIEMLERREAWTEYPITFIVDDTGEGLRTIAQTTEGIHPERIIGYFQAGLLSLIDSLEHQPQREALGISILPESEERLLRSWQNVASTENRPRPLIHELFEIQAKQTPNARAAVFEDRSLTYGELNEKAGRLARYLLSVAPQPGEIIGIHLERGLDLIVTIVAVLKAGAAYLPIDHSWPADRIKYVIEDARPIIVVTERALQRSLPQMDATILVVDDEWKSIGDNRGQALSNEVPQATSRQLAYVIYTSGSTGHPKGVMVEHENVTRLFSATVQSFEFSSEDVWTLFHSYAFDFSVWEMWGALLFGGTLVVVPLSVARSPEKFYSLVCERKVTVLNQTPSAFAQFIDAQENSHDRHSLKTVIFGGEALDVGMLRRWVKNNRNDAPKLVNMYGITETTVHVTYHLVSLAEIETERGSLIGKPISDLRAYVLDRRLNLIPRGVAGELYVAGPGVTRGYNHRAQLTSQRFVADRFSEAGCSRMYRTGDTARWRDDGVLEYLGRNDGQVKIRGHRLELGEIKAALQSHTSVREALVLMRKDDCGEKRLVAYFVASAGVSPTATSLSNHLRRLLPEYMIPAAFVRLDEFPLTTNGKTNIGALPIPDPTAYAHEEYVAPLPGIEASLARIWQELLRVDRVGRYDNFFELGGHSVLATRMIVRVRQELKVSIDLRALLRSPTVQALGTEIAATMGDSESVVQPSLETRVT